MANWWKRTKDSELEEEVRSHLEMSAREYSDRGESRESAERSAHREFGNESLVKATVRDLWRGQWWEELLQDFRFGARLLRKNVRFALVAVITLALGIGANTAIFSLVNGILLRPLPFPHPQQLLRATGFYPKGAFSALREQVTTMDVATYAEGHELNLTGHREPVRLNATLVSAELFSVLGKDPQLGKVFVPGEDLAGRNNSAILSYALWKNRFAGDGNVIGSWIQLEGVQRQIVGVMPADFRFPSPQTEVWVPLNIDSSNIQSSWAGDFMPVIGRLHQNATMQQASAEIGLFQSRIAKAFPWPMPSNWNAGIAMQPLHEGIVEDVRSRLLILLAAVTLVLLIACANVANLTLSRATVRAKEIAIRTSLGAGRKRIVRQLMVESVVLAFFGGTLGLVLASAGTSLLKATFPANTPRLADTSLDWHVLLFTLGLTIATAVLCGLAPALQSSRSELTESLKAGSRGSTLSGNIVVRRALVISELALAVLLASGAGLLIRSLWSLSHLYPGFRAEDVITARIRPNESFCENPGRCFSFYKELVDRVRATPGVHDAALVSTLPLDGRVNKRSVEIENYATTSESAQPLLWLNPVSPGYMKLMNIAVLGGRDFSESDTLPSAHVAIVSAATAKRFWPQQDALGKHIRFVGQKDWCMIVGIAGDVHGFDLRNDKPEWMDGVFYVPYGPDAVLENGKVPAEMTMVVSSSQDQSQLGASIRSIASTLDPDTPVADIKTLLAVVSDAANSSRSVTSLFGAFAALALVLGAVGIYGLISYFVAQRSREIGIRIALGAQKSDVLKLVLQEGVSLTLAGVGAGLAVAFALTRFLSSLLYGVQPTDPVDFIAVAFLFGAVALLASYLPARRAMRVDPMVALRYE
ncbi:MAG TPA: ABC transporter permease [Candidatus Saccharimonadales bacterium]|nr:ABC transporter permease [Candidatus Saccharimonadales bacterium]